MAPGLSGLEATGFVPGAAAEFAPVATALQVPDGAVLTPTCRLPVGKNLLEEVEAVRCLAAVDDKGEHPFSPVDPNEQCLDFDLLSD